MSNVEIEKCEMILFVYLTRLKFLFLTLIDLFHFVFGVLSIGHHSLFQED